MKNDFTLCIDSSANYLGLGLLKGYEKVFIQNIQEKNIHDKMLAQNVSHLLSEFEIKVNDLNAISIIVGPGSFTGLRVGIAFVKALCFNNIPKLVSITSMENYAFQLKDRNKNISVILNSHSSFYYFQRFNSKLEELNNCELVDVANYNFQDIEGDYIIGNYSNYNSSIELNKIEYLMDITSYKLENLQYTDVKSLKANYIQNFTPKISIKK